MPQSNLSARFQRERDFLVMQGLVSPAAEVQAQLLEVNRLGLVTYDDEKRLHMYKRSIAELTETSQREDLSEDVRQIVADAARWQSLLYETLWISLNPISY